jgi:gliding motility-associated-like protein
VRFNNSQSSHTISLIVEQDICTELRSRQISLSPNPIANFVSSTQQICPPFPVNFTNLSLNADQANYLWIFGDGDSSSAENPSHTFLKSGDYEVQLIGQTTDNCIDTVTFADSIFASRAFSPNSIKFGVEPSEGCSPLEVRFIDASEFIGNAQYYWGLDNNNLSNDPSPTFTYTDSGYYDIDLLLITSDLCDDTLQLSIDSAIRVFPDPVASMSLSDDTVSLKQALIEVDASMSSDYTAGRLLVNGEFFGTNERASIRFRDTGVHVISWIVENEFNCTDTVNAELYIFDEFEFVVPNIFTPNGDGVNDVFKVRACGVYGYQISIFNRYGKEVYSSTSLQEGWNGRINEYKASPGVYFYRIVIRDLNGEYRNYEGSFSLLYE